MNKIKKILLLLVILPFNCFAIEFYCDNTVLSNGIFNCVISNTSNSLAELNALLEYSPEIKLIKTNYTKGYTSNGSGNNIGVSGPGLNAQTTIAVLNFKAPIVSSDQRFNVALKNIKYKYLATEVNYHDNTDLNAFITVKKSEEQTTTKNPEDKEFTVKISDTNVVKTCKTTADSCNIDLSDIAPVSKEGYIFKVWNNDSNCTSGYTKTFEAKSDTTLYACFEKDTTTTTINYLSKISIDDKVLEDVSKEKFSYNYTVENDIKAVSVVAEAESKTAVIKISENISNLVIGENVVTIDVIDNNITTTYILIITRLEKGTELNIPLLNGLLVNGKEISIENNKFDLSITVEYGTKKVDLIPITASGDSTFIITGNDNLQNGSIINIKVTAPDESFSTYNIKVNYESFAKTYMYYIYAGCMFIFCLIVYLIVKIIKKKKSNLINNDKSNKTSKKINEKKTNDKKVKKKVKEPKKKPNKKEEVETLK